MAGASTQSTTPIRRGPATARTVRRAIARLPLPFLTAALLAVSACTPQQPAPAASPSSAAPEPVTIEINQSRDQYGQHAILLQLTNTTEGLLTVDGARVNSPLFDADIEWAPQAGSLELPPHQPKSVQAQLPGPACAGPVAASSQASATVSVTAAGRQPEELPLPAPDPFDVLPRNNAELCLAADAAMVAGLGLDPHLEVAADGRTAVVRLRISPRPAGPGATPSLTLHGVGGTPLLAEAMTGFGAEPWPRNVTFLTGEPDTVLALRVRPARCDPHAVAEDKVGTLLPLNVAVGAREGVLKVAAGGPLRAQLYDFVTRACQNG
ncbi:conserved hypothetical protein [Pseudarthrobacter chlorophenolicus A6]|uniref:Uncharacterized protein n=1 Tax=Pseudarthrobacter chlorophenolicus (strain ATCC 700700 / DSM 12829 / CIP 107037 / JCM 12360 / KCTC 9906 / NCIMB 13794 / A6) TaxID=452863 RepID=B8H9G8_PSECP|nr:hypothetical protein [Pseudarthrobacter chlorophenolicus]ACL40037.1 conserved hypothetical protein [Pseudarthrobacter chlorophenolicus A6]SDQ89117.1 hypothetical protein SAMN04489738_3437 [Pseudarthrobacter chlorophenolicus]